MIIYCEIFILILNEIKFFGIFFLEIVFIGRNLNRIKQKNSQITDINKLLRIQYIALISFVDTSREIPIHTLYIR